MSDYIDYNKSLIEIKPIENPQFTLQQPYDNPDGHYMMKAVSNPNDMDTTKLGVEEASRKFRDRSSEMLMFFEALVPYFVKEGAEVGQTIAESAEGKNNVTDYVGLVSGGVDAAFKLKYTNPLEWVKMLTLNFATIKMFKGITIKTASKGFFGYSLPFETFSANNFYTNKTGGPLSPTIFDTVRDNKSKDIGNVYVYPIGAMGVDTSKDNDRVRPLKIPIQFNPNIVEGAHSASYQASQILNRAEDLQTYINSNSPTVSFSTRYIALTKKLDVFEEANASSLNDGNYKFFSDKDNLGDVTLHGWTSKYDLEYIQEIEYAYRSLVYGSQRDISDIENPWINYSKPPLIKIIVGDKKSSNILTQAREIGGVDASSLSNKSFNNNKRFKTFVAVSVSIKKDLENTPLQIKDGLIIDTIGFDVSMELLEVKPTYTDLPATFMDYADKADSLRFIGDM